ncbi:MAG: hypothetical protein EA000_01950 [Oscillatoriales cyanobacterium]|nr:MAG: hypothetical protein EA000_01950 [Oscillatoriales cyanobacterium]
MEAIGKFRLAIVSKKIKINYRFTPKSFPCLPKKSSYNTGANLAPPIAQKELEQEIADRRGGCGVW